MIENYSLSDIAAATGNDRNGWGDGMNGGWWWIIVLFLFIFGNNGWGRGNNGCVSACEQPVTTTQFESETNFRTLDNKLNQINNGLCNLGYTQAQLINDSAAQTVGAVTSEGRALQMQLADCCCTTQRAIDSVKLENEHNTQKIIDALTTNRIAAMQEQINQLQLNAALCGVVRYPNTFSYNAGANPFCGSGCGCGNGVSF